MSTSPFPWSEGESFVFDADEKIICREHHTENLNWKDDRALIAAIPEMIAALETARTMIKGETIENAVVDVKTMQPLGGLLDNVLQKVKRP